MDDTPEARRTAARHYMAAMPLIDDITEAVAQALGASPGQRVRIAELLRPHEAEIEGIQLEGLVVALTAAELEALTQFVSTRAGRSAMRKMPTLSAFIGERVAPFGELLTAGLAGVP